MNKQKILVLGGTQFIGRNLVESLIKEDSYDIFLFNRQQTGSDLFPQLNRIKGDRHTNDIKQIEGIEWDYVIDVSCYYPADLSIVLACINQNVKNYIFVSTCSVYDTDLPLLARDEKSPILTCSEAESIDTTNASYGNRKAACELIVSSSSINHTILRPALVFGQYDHTDRFYYWLYQVHSYNQLLVPNLGSSLFSVTYVHDLVNAITLSMNQQSSSVIYNVTSKIQFSITQLIERAEELMNKPVRKVNAPGDFLVSEKIQQWIDMPLWIDSDYFTFDNSLIKKQLGLEFTNMNTAIDATIKYYDSLGWPVPKYGISNELKLKLLNKRLSE